MNEVRRACRRVRSKLPDPLEIELRDGLGAFCLPRKDMGTVQLGQSVIRACLGYELVVQQRCPVVDQRELLGETLQRDRLASAGSAGNQSVTVGECGQQGNIGIAVACNNSGSK